MEHPRSVRSRALAFVAPGLLAAVLAVPGRANAQATDAGYADASEMTPVGPLTPRTLCILAGHELHEIAVDQDSVGHYFINFRPLMASFPSDPPYAIHLSWYTEGRPLQVRGVTYVKYGLPRVLGIHDVVPFNNPEGYEAFAEPTEGDAGTPVVIYLPVEPGCVFQPYQIQVETPAPPARPAPSGHGRRRRR